MCDPMSILTGASAVVGFVGSQQAASQQAAYQAQLTAQRNADILANSQAANQAAIDSYTQIGQEEIEQQQKLSADTQDLNIEWMNKLGEIAASNLNTGMSYDALRLNVGREADRYAGVNELNMKNLGIQANRERYEAQKNAEARANSIDSYIPSPVNKPNPLNLFVGLGGAYAQHEAWKEQKEFFSKTLNK